MKKIIISILVLVLLCSVVLAQQQTQAGPTLISAVDGTCPQYAPHAPDWCEDGTIVAGEVDDDGCIGPPSCEDEDATGTGIESVTVTGTDTGTVTGTGIESVTVTGTDTGTVTGTETDTGTVTGDSKGQAIAALKQKINQKKEELESETENLGNKYKQKVFKNQNAVRLAVHSLLAMEDRIGGIGQQISQIAREFNNSIKATINLEERIQKRSRFVKFFVGGDEEAAEELEEETKKNEEKIKKLKQLKEECDCEEEIKALIQEQIASMEGEQVRLKNLAQAEKKIRGIFSWLRRSSD